MENYPYFPVQDSSCVDRNQFYYDMHEYFGNPIGSHTSSKVVSDDRCKACFNYLIQVELRNLSNRNCGRIVEKLTSLGYDVDKMGDHEDQQHFQNQPKYIQRELKRFYDMKQINAQASHLLQFNDDQKHQGGIKTQRIWGRQTKDLIGTGKRQRFFVELLPQPLGSKPEYRLIFFKDPEKYVIVPPSNWFDVLTTIHANHGHKGRDIIFALVRKKYFNVPKYAIERFTLLCKIRNSNFGSSSKVPRLMDLGTSSRSSTQIEDPDCKLTDDSTSLANTNKKSFLSRLHLFIMSNQYTQHVKMDILCLRDFATDFIKLYSLEQNTVDTVSQCISEFMRTYGGIEIIHWSDDIDDRFLAAVIETVNENWEYPIIVGDPLSSTPEVAEIERLTMKYTHDFCLYHHTLDLEIDAKAWSKLLDSTTFAVNCRIKKNGLSPYEEVFNRPPNLSAIAPHLTHGRINKTGSTSYVKERDIKPAEKRSKKIAVGDLLNDDTDDDYPGFK